MTTFKYVTFKDISQTKVLLQLGMWRKNISFTAEYIIIQTLQKNLVMFLDVT